MQLTLTITPNDSLPESTLRAFVAKAAQEKKDPTATLAGLIQAFVSSPATRPTRKNRRAKA